MTLRQFVQDTIQNIDDFDANNINSIKKLIRLVIEDFQFGTEVEETEIEGNEVLYIASSVEEDLLSQIAEFAVGTEEETSIEAVFEGCVVRKYS
jgi:hypothetical protein